MIRAASRAVQFVTRSNATLRRASTEGQKHSAVLPEAERDNLSPRLAAEKYARKRNLAVFGLFAAVSAPTSIYLTR